MIAWSEEPREHTAREALFIALVGSPVTAALLGLAEIAEAGGDAQAADELRAPRRDRVRLSRRARLAANQ